MSTTVYVTPHSAEPQAVAATVATLEAIPGGHRVLRDHNSAPVLQAGRLVIFSDAADFLRFAVQQQGYAKDAEIGPVDSPLDTFDRVTAQNAQSDRIEEQLRREERRG